MRDISFQLGMSSLREGFRVLLGVQKSTRIKPAGRSHWVSVYLN